MLLGGAHSLVLMLRPEHGVVGTTKVAAQIQHQGKIPHKNQVSVL